VSFDVLLVGNEGYREFQDCIRWLRNNTRLTAHADVDGAVEWLNSSHGATCHSIVLAHERPGVLRNADIERLHRAAPLARLVGLLGSWCEGEMRSGNPWPGVVRVYWHEFVARAEREWSTDATVGVWRLARTATENDRALSAAEHTLPRGQGLIAVYASSLVGFSALADALNQGGWSTAWCHPQQPSPVRGASAMVWDFVTPTPTTLHEFEVALRSWPAVPALAVCGFPRYDDVVALRRAGAQHVLSKPLLIDDLWHTLVTIRRSETRPHAA
jgi:hypothetical protein